MSCKNSLFPLIKEISVYFFMSACCFFSFQRVFQQIICIFAIKIIQNLEFRIHLHDT